MRDPRELPLGQLRARLQGERRTRVLRRWSRILVEDPRAGAQELAAVCQRRASEEAAERRRVLRLFSLRRKLVRGGAHVVAGVDEVGVGPLAGPVVAAAVVLPERVDLGGLDDSKKLTRLARERLDAAIRGQALAVGIGRVEPPLIDRINIYHAALEAMRRAVAELSESLEPDHVLVDARTIPGIEVDQTALPGGDGIDGSIAAASIVAKVHRDGIMRRLDARHPGYGFASHKGYATRDHLAALYRLGPTPQHRRSFEPVAVTAGLR